ncbi:MAG: hypothetical protein CUN53_02570 [Phototrophicales bacterium]|nr:MAG: hypothetical protein CUN53_02570 [Phototrophicales bacterium]
MKRVSLLLFAALMALIAAALVVPLSVPVWAQSPAPTDPPTLIPPTALGSFENTRVPYALSGIWGIAGDQNVVIRSGPGTAFPRIGILRAGASIDITGTNGFNPDRACSNIFANDLDMWVEVRYREQDGWIARCALTIRGDDLGKLPIEAPPLADFTPPVPTAFPGARG